MTKKTIQIFLLVTLAVALIRLGLIYQGRQDALPDEQNAAPPLEADYYVTPKKLYAYDLKSVRQLTQQPVWVREGYRYTYYPFAGGRVEFKREAGLLGPIQKLEIKDVAEVPDPNGGGRKQVVAVFEKEGNSYSVPVGIASGGSYTIYADEVFYIQDPQQLYSHWPADVWQSIRAGEVKPGMNELQAAFALGTGKPHRSDDPSQKTVTYERGGVGTVTVTFRNGRAADIQKAQEASLEKK
jgi:hypothetical protein